MKKILFFIDALVSGGAEKSILALLHSIDYSRYSVDMLLYSETGIYNDCVPEQVNVILMNSLPGWDSPARKLSNIFYSVRLRLMRLAGIKRHFSETLWSTTGRFLPRVPGHYDAAIAYQQGLPTYYIIDKVDADRKFAWANVDLLGAGYRPAFNRPFYDRYDGVNVVSKALASPMADDGFADPAKIGVIYDILSEPMIKGLADKNIEEADKEIMSRAPGQTLLVTVGRLNRQKNYPLAVETAAVLRSRGLDFKWIFLGDGPEEQNILDCIDRHGLRDRVFPIGLRMNPYPYIKAADFYVHTASFEGYGLTIAEAKILDKPVVSTNFTVVTDQITDGINGLIAEMSAESLADKIMALVNDPDLRERITAAVKSETNTTEQSETEKFYKLID